MQKDEIFPDTYFLKKEAFLFFRRLKNIYPRIFLDLFTLNDGILLFLKDCYLFTC